MDEKISRDNWRDYADCRKVNAELFFPEDGGSARQAINICRSCDARRFCLLDALAFPISLPGIYGGTGKRERDKMRQAGPATWPKLDVAA